jgi:hypothetical protein
MTEPEAIEALRNTLVSLFDPALGSGSIAEALWLLVGIAWCWVAYQLVRLVGGFLWKLGLGRYR